jgi:hypothetical protein
MGGQGGNRLENRVRGNASQLLEKYKQLARDAHQGGDRVAAEYYLQYADHYFRVLNDSRIRQEEMRARRGVFDQMDEEADEEQDARADDIRNRDRPDADEQPRQSRGSARGQPLRDANGHRGHGRDVSEDEERDLAVARGRAASAHEDEESDLSDGEAALIAFGGVPSLAERAPTRAPESVEGEADAEAAERTPRRRGRPRKTPAPAIET